MAAAVAMALCLAACATPPPASDPEALADYRTTNDQFEPANRFFYKIDDGLDTYYLPSDRRCLPCRGARGGAWAGP